MREIYRKDDLIKALMASLDNEDFCVTLSVNLINAKITRLTLEHKKLMKIYNRDYKAMIEENISKNPNDYSVSSIMVGKINKLVKKIDLLVKSINFYTDKLNNSYNLKSMVKRKKLILNLIK